MRLVLILLFVFFGVQLNAEKIKLDCKSANNSDQFSYLIDIENNLIHSPSFLVSPRTIKVSDEYITWTPVIGSWTINSISVLERKSLLLIKSHITEKSFNEFGGVYLRPQTWSFQCIRGI